MNKKNTVAVLVMLVVIVGVGLIFYSGQRALHYIGPSKLLAGPNGVLHVVSHGRIHQFDGVGVRTGSLNLADFGRSLTPSDLAVYRDGRFLVSDPAESAVYRCQPLTRACERFNLDVGTFGHTPGNALKFFLDEQRGRIYFSDNAGHRVLITDLDGVQLSRNDRAQSRFRFPNQLWPEGENELFVVNTNGHAVMGVDVKDDQVGKARWKMSTLAPAHSRPGHDWPFAAIHEQDGSWWILNAVNGMKDADLLRFDKDGAALERIDLGEASDPFGILKWQGRVLVADATQYRIQTLGSDSKVGEDFGDAAFRQELVQARATPLFWQRVRFAAQISVFIFPLLGVVLLLKLGAYLAKP